MYKDRFSNFLIFEVLEKFFRIQRGKNKYFSAFLKIPRPIASFMDDYKYLKDRGSKPKAIRLSIRSLIVSESPNGSLEYIEVEWRSGSGYSRESRALIDQCNEMNQCNSRNLPTLPAFDMWFYPLIWIYDSECCTGWRNGDRLTSHKALVW